jgi:signal transduction histidine kinase/ligand-binding sensor domain-containing protein
MLFGLLALSGDAHCTAAPKDALIAAELPVSVNARLARRAVNLPIIEGKDIRFHRLSTSDGLSQTRVAEIVQDDQGFIWFGTQYGLNRFDGYKFKVFAHDPKQPDSLGGVYITALFKDRSGVLWIGCGQFLDRFDRRSETFTHFRLDSGDPDDSTLAIQNINQDRFGRLWLSTGKGLYSLDPATARITRYTHNPNDATTIGNSAVIMTGEDRSGTFWVAHSEGMDRFDPGTGTVNLHVFLGESGNGLTFHQDRQGLFWIMYGAEGNLGVFDSTTKTITRYSRIEDEKSRGRWNPITAMIEDKDGTMWFGTGADGLLKFDRGKKRFIRYANHPDDSESLADSRVIALFQDSEGNFWIGLHQAGPSFFSRQSFLFGNPAQQAGQSVVPGLVSVIHEDRDGIVWLGAGNGILRRLDRKNGTSVTFNQTQGTDVLSIAEETPDILWLGTSGDGLVRYDRKAGETKRYKNDPLDQTSLSSNLIDKILISHDRVLWAATWDGLDRFDPATGHFQVFKPQANARGLNLHAIAEDTNGELWLGSNLGLYRFDPTTAEFTNYKNDLLNTRTLSDNRVNSIFFDHSGVMWVGTQNGLDQFDGHSGKFTAYVKEDGLAGNVVSCILEDNRHALWMSTNNGISFLDPSRKHFKSYGTSDGLPGFDLTGWGACAKGSDGEMFFGGFGGSTAFYPDKVSDSSYIPQITLTDFRLFGAEVKLGPNGPLKESISSSSAVSLSYQQNFFSLEFSVLSFRDASANRYRYMLEGLDRHWIEAESDGRIATYTAVPPGTYRFRVQGATRRGTWSAPGVSLQLNIHPPWWSTWWFRLACLFMSATTVWVLYRLRVRQTTERLSIRFEERLTERARIARELHDTLLQSIQGLILRFHNIGKAIPETDPARQLIDKALDRAEDVLAEGRDRVNGLRSSSGSYGDLSNTFSAICDELSQIRNAKFRVVVEGETRELNAIVHDEIGQIGREALTNAFQHAGAEEIEVEISYARRDLRVRVLDDGCGIEPQVLADGEKASHWGLLGMRERARKIGGILEIRSSPKVGTEIELRIPAEHAYRNVPGSHGWSFKRLKQIHFETEV